ncbi:MAG: hypothetical protein ACKVS9_06440 [Phycisphaerae bacterium]
MLISGALPARATLVDAQLRCSRFEYSDMSGAVLANCDCSGSSGWHGKEMVHVGSPLIYDRSRPCRFQRWGAGNWYGDFPAWSQLKSLGDLPFFALSNALLATILAYAGIAEWFNGMVDAVKAADSPGTPPWVVHLRHLPAPVHLGRLLLSLLALLTASVLYKIACPSVVKEFAEIEREDKYIYQLEYESADYSKMSLRYAIGVLFCIGGVYTVYYFFRRVISAAYFFLTS